MDMNELFKGSILANVVAAAMAGNFTPCTSPMEEGEKKIGELTVWQKALREVKDKLAEEHNAKVQELKKLTRGRMPHGLSILFGSMLGGMLDMEELMSDVDAETDEGKRIIALRKEVKALSNQYEFLNELFWKEVRSTTPHHHCMCDFRGIRDGDIIVGHGHDEEAGSEEGASTTQKEAVTA